MHSDSICYSRGPVKTLQKLSLGSRNNIIFVGSIFTWPDGKQVANL